VLVLLGGRGSGKTRSGAEWVRKKADEDPGCRIALVAATPGDARDVMLEGSSGLLNVCPPWNMPTYEPSRRKLTWPNGSEAHLYSGADSTHLNGPAHAYAWADELREWKDPEAWNMLMLGLRLGDDPRCIVTTTPRPRPFLKKILNDSRTRVVKMTTYDNALNLAPGFIEKIIRQYEGTRLGRQELLAHMLEDNPGALWQATQIELCRVDSVDVETLRSVVVGVDPAVTSGEESDETGIVSCGVDHEDHGYVLADVSLRGTPDAWAKRAVSAYHDFQADKIIAEKNQGGEMVEHTIHTKDKNVPVELVHASRGKRTRAEPISALSEQGRIHHAGTFEFLEDEMTGWDPDAGDPSPSRMDAMVWAFTKLMLEPHSIGVYIDAPKDRFEMPQGVVETHGGRPLDVCARAGCERCRERLKRQ